MVGSGLNDSVRRMGDPPRVRRKHGTWCRFARVRGYTSTGDAEKRRAPMDWLNHRLAVEQRIYMQQVDSTRTAGLLRRIARGCINPSFTEGLASDVPV